MVLAKEGNLEMYHELRPKLHFIADVFLDDTDYKPTVINTPFLIPKEKGKVMNEGQRIFNDLTKTFMDNLDEKCLVVRSRYGSGKNDLPEKAHARAEPRKGPVHNLPPNTSTRCLAELF